MFRRFQKENCSSGNSECERAKENNLPDNESTLIKVIGAVNVKRWNALKTIFTCRTNIEFASKLLEIAHQFLNKKTGELAALQDNPSKEKDRSKENVCETAVGSKKNGTLASKVSSKNKTEKKITKTKDEHRQDYLIPSNRLKDDLTTQHLQMRHPSKENELSLSEMEKSAIKLEAQRDNCDEKTSSLDVIKIKLCYYCNTHHIQDHCPVNLPQYKLFDSVILDMWNHKYKPLYDNYWNNVKKEHEAEKSETNDEEDLKYSYAVVSLPARLQVAETNTAHGLGIFAKDNIECFTQMGPLVGKIVKEMDIPEDFNMKYLWEISVGGGQIYLSTEDNETSNWIKFIRPAPTREDKNLTVIVRDEKLYFISMKAIKPGEELLYWQDTLNQYQYLKKKIEKTSCGGCNITFIHPHYYRMHCSIFHDVRYSLTIKKYHCKVCGAAVLGKENIMKHAAELHNGQGAYQCQFCKKFFLRLNYLEMHRTYGCSANPHRSVPLCDFCGKKFCQPQKLKVHIKRMHSDMSEVLKEFQCKECLKILGSRAALQRHAKEVHQKLTDIQWSCSRCGKKFQNKSNLKIHMLTHSGIKPFKCSANGCKSAFTTKQCLQFHYKKVHHYTDENMPKIERSIDYTFQAYSGGDEVENEDVKNKMIDDGRDDRNSEDSDESIDSQIDDPIPLQRSPKVTTPHEEHSPSPPRVSSPHPLVEKLASTTIGTTGMKVLSKGSKKWIGNELMEQTAHKISDIYPSIVHKINKEDLPVIPLSVQENDIYDRNKLGISEFSRHEASNASLLVEAALDSVCNEPNLDIDVSSSQNCTDTLVNNLYSLTQNDNLPDVSYSVNESRDINLMSPSVNDHISVTDDLNDKLRHSDSIGMNYSEFHQNDFSPPHSPSANRSNFVRNYINSLSPQNMTYQPQQQQHKGLSPEPMASRYAEHFSSDDSNGMAVQNLSLHASKNEIQLDLSIYKNYKTGQDYMKKFGLEHNKAAADILEQEQIEVDQPIVSSDSEKKTEDTVVDIRNKFDIDLDMRLKSYEAIERNHMYDSSEVDFRSKSYDISEVIESRSKQYELESDFGRSERAFEPLMLNTSELQGLDMSARSGFHSYAANIGRYHHLYPEVDRVDALRLNYSPPPPPPPPSAYSHAADLLRVVSLDLTTPPGGRHTTVDLSIRNHHPALHQLANGHHRSLLEPGRLLSTDLQAAATRHLSAAIGEAGGRLLTDHTTSRILNEPMTAAANHLLNSDESRLLSDQSRLLDQSRLIGDARMLQSVSGSGAVSPGFSGYSVSQNPYHPTPIAPRPHVTSPTPAAYHYTAYY